MESLSYLEIFRQRWRAILIAVVVGVGSAALIAFSIAPTYTSTATLFLSVKDVNATLAERSQFSLARVNSYTDLVRSSEVLEPVISDLGLDLTVQELRSQVSATNPNSTVNINIAAQASSAQDAARIANAVADSLSRLVSRVENFGTFSVSLERLIPALPPAAPSAPQKTVILGLGLVAGLAAGAVLALLLARFDHRMRQPSDVRRVTGLPVLAAVPRGHRRSRGNGADPESTVEAAYTEALARITQANGGTVPRILLLAPAGATANHASVSLGVVGAVSATGRQALFVEAEVSGGDDTALGHFAGTAGLAELLNESTTLPEVTRTLDGSEALFVSAGVAETTEVAADKTLRSVLTRLISRADVVITQATSESRPLSIPLIAPFVEVAMIVVRYNHTSEAELAQTVSQLRIAGVRPLGVVLTGVPNARHLELMATWTPDDFAGGPAKAHVHLRRKASKTAAPTATATATAGPSTDTKVGPDRKKSMASESSPSPTPVPKPSPPKPAPPSGRTEPADASAAERSSENERVVVD
ncbi:Wzz/FepE/Etk N-terminal domain-containing protein [Salinibacterium sp. NYA9b]